MSTTDLPLAQLEALYHREYYLGDCEGYEVFARTGGRKLPRRLAKCLALIDPRPGERLLDVGSGRGELALHAAARGAEVVAIDPSADALAVLEEPRRQHWSDTRVHQVRARGEQLPLADRWADAAVVSDVVEHLPPPALKRLLSECRRVLAPGGRIIIHTQPNRRLTQCTIPLLARFSRLWGVTLPADLRDEMTPGAGREYHVNELTRGELGRLLRLTGFQIEELWLEGTYPIHRIFGDTRLKKGVLALFRRSRWLKEWLASQVFAVATIAQESAKAEDR